MLYRLEAGIRERKLEGRAKLDFRSRHALLIDTSHLEQALRVIPMGRNYPRLVVMEGFEVRVSSNRRLFSSASLDLH